MEAQLVFLVDAVPKHSPIELDASYVPLVITLLMLDPANNVQFPNSQPMPEPVRAIPATKVFKYGPIKLDAPSVQPVNTLLIADTVKIVHWVPFLPLQEQPLVLLVDAVKKQ